MVPRFVLHHDPAVTHEYVPAAWFSFDADVVRTAVWAIPVGVPADASKTAKRAAPKVSRKPCLIGERKLPLYSLFTRLGARFRTNLEAALDTVLEHIASLTTRRRSERPSMS